MPNKQSDTAEIRGSVISNSTSLLSLQSLIQEIIRTLSDFDSEYNLQLHEIDRSVMEEELKTYAKAKLRGAHRERREPYVDRLTDLQEQKRRSSLAA
jgi:hypothetical protein